MENNKPKYIRGQIGTQSGLLQVRVVWRSLSPVNLRGPVFCAFTMTGRVASKTVMAVNNDGDEVLALLEK